MSRLRRETRADWDSPSVEAAKRKAEPEVQWEYIPRIEPGEYRAYCRAAKIYPDRQFKRWICAVHFDVLNDALETVARLTWFLNLGSGEKPHVGRRSNYWQAWLQANGGPPRRKDRLSPRIFVHRYAVVTVGDTRKNHRQEAIPGEQAYSVIRDMGNRRGYGP